MELTKAMAVRTMKVMAMVVAVNETWRATLGSCQRRQKWCGKETWASDPTTTRSSLGDVLCLGPATMTVTIKTTSHQRAKAKKERRRWRKRTKEIKCEEGVRKVVLEALKFRSNARGRGGEVKEVAIGAGGAGVVVVVHKKLISLCRG